MFCTFRQSKKLNLYCVPITVNQPLVCMEWLKFKILSTKKTPHREQMQYVATQHFVMEKNGTRFVNYPPS